MTRARIGRRQARPDGATARYIRPLPPPWLAAAATRTRPSAPGEAATHEKPNDQ